MATSLFLLPTHQNPTFQSNFSPKSIKFQSFPLFSQKRLILSNFNSSSQSQPSSISYENTQNPSKFNTFLTNEEFKTLKFLENYTYKHKLPSGYLTIRAMKDNELEKTVELLAESFVESMFLPVMYLTLLGYLIKQYLIDRRALMPYCVTLIGFISEDFFDDKNGEKLAGTVEVSFDRRGANATPPTPTPPKNCPYICNMAVKENLRRRGIGWHLLKASEELISIMSSSRNVYLHCRLIDSAPFNMYKKAGYDVVKTDSFLVLLTLQRRKHLMFKELPALSKPLETVISGDEIEISSMDANEPEPALLDEVLQSSLDMDG